MNRSEILSVIREELAVAAPDVPGDADPTAHLGLDLEVDSLAVLEFVARLEYRFGLVVSDDAWPGLTHKSPVVLVHELVVLPAQEHEVRKRRRSTVGVVNDVMALDEDPHLAPREHAHPVIARFDRSAQRRRDRSRRLGADLDA